MSKIQREKTSVLSVSLPIQVNKNAREFAHNEDMTVSQLVSKALKSYILKQEWEKLRRDFRPLARKLKIKTDEDVERIFK